MNDRTTVEKRVDTLEKQVGELTRALAIETKDRKSAQADLELQLRLLAELLADNNSATGYAIQYLNRLDAQYYAKDVMLQDTIQTFNEFLKLPPKSSRYLAIWDAAWETLAAVVPAMRLTKAFSTMEKLSQIEMASAKAFMKTPVLVARITTAAAKGHNVADVIRKGNSIREKVTKATGSFPGTVDRSRTPVRELIAESDAARKAFDQAIEALDAEFEARLNGILFKMSYPSAETLVSKANKLLPPLDYLDSAALDQIGRFYLWTILSGYAKQHIAIVTTRYRTGDSIHIDGLNDAQIEQVMEWFGPSSNWQGGRVPIIATIGYALSLWQVGTRTESSGGAVFGFG
jgi:hypothetical protein